MLRTINTSLFWRLLFLRNKSKSSLVYTYCHNRFLRHIFENFTDTCPILPLKIRPQFYVIWPNSIMFFKIAVKALSIDFCFWYWSANCYSVTYFWTSYIFRSGFYVFYTFSTHWVLSDGLKISGNFWIWTFAELSYDL